VLITLPILKLFPYSPPLKQNNHKNSFQPGVVAHIYDLAIPVIWEIEMGKIVVRGQTGQKVQETPISNNKKLGVVVYACHPSSGRKYKTEGLWSKPAQA
jgi:hypothetical protein